MPSHTRPTLTLRENTSLFLLFWTSVLPRTLLTLLTHLLQRTRPSWNIKFLAATSLLQNASPIPFRTRLSWMPTTGEAIATYGQAVGVKVHSEDIPVTATRSRDGHTITVPPAKLHYIDCLPTDAGGILLWFHGGGYIYPLNLGPSAPYGGHIALARQAAQQAGLHNVALLEYDLAPGLRYPGQLAQACAAVGSVLRTHEAGEVVLAGDSAGGNLVLGVLGHVARPSGYCGGVEMGAGARFRGALLMAPWVGLGRGRGSYKRNKWRDYIPTEDGDAFLEAWRPRQEEVWADALNWDPVGLRGLPVADVLITAGSWEVLVDDLVVLGERWGAKVDWERLDEGEASVTTSGKGGDGEVRVRLVVAPEEVHVMPLWESMLDLPEGLSARAIKDWCAEIRR